MTVSTVVAAGLVIAFAGVLVWTVWSLVSGRPSVRRGSGNPGLPPHGVTMPGTGADCGGSSGGDGSSGGG
ncbi:hypothetical protein HTZ77_07790 [Nonomuraea sp. SMC257]|uniref:Uncharacterized protein n=1 Tax=Nonomuraea montanisoli TaxID=2741721 RepID=A0A7Y6M2M5_9ACTN|nr:hypothetical protein [Nonomuraea montanisoli]NUW31324.1 hypothetical protein [Nonomuraea montanisoli]